MIREITHSDVAAVVAGCEWLFEPPASPPSLWDPAAAAERVHALRESPAGTAFVAEREGTVVGFCTVYLDLVSIRLGQRAWLNELAVHPAWRSQGIGERLLDAGREWARSMGATHLLVDSNVARVDAHRFYERQTPDLLATCFGWLLWSPAGAARRPNRRYWPRVSERSGATERHTAPSIRRARVRQQSAPVEAPTVPLSRQRGLGVGAEWVHHRGGGGGQRAGGCPIQV